MAATFGVSPQKLAALRAKMCSVGMREQDLIERFMTARGPGGQRTNKVSTRVHLVHQPTRLEVNSQRARSQALNRFHARRLLALKLERQLLHAASEEEQRRQKIRRQKRRRSRRAKEKMLVDKRRQSLKKQLRATPDHNE